MRKLIVRVFLAVALAASAAGCAEWLAASDAVREASFQCQRDPTTPGCYPPGWEYRPGMGF